jgi:hypothetical protein
MQLPFTDVGLIVAGVVGVALLTMADARRERRPAAP